MIVRVVSSSGNGEKLWGEEELGEESPFNYKKQDLA